MFCMEDYDSTALQCLIFPALLAIGRDSELTCRDRVLGGLYMMYIEWNGHIEADHFVHCREFVYIATV